MNVREIVCKSMLNRSELYNGRWWLFMFVDGMLETADFDATRFSLEQAAVEFVSRFNT